MAIFINFANIFIGDIIMVFVVAFWNTCWNLQDTYLLVDYPELSNVISLSVGVFGLILLACLQFKLTKYSDKTNIFVFTIVSRIIALIWAVFGVCHWRGLWNFLYICNEYSFVEIFLSAVTVLLCLLRSVRNILVSPFVIGFDGHREQFFHQSMNFDHIINISLPYGLNVVLSVILLGSLVASFWWGAWTLMDNHLFPENSIKTTVTCFIIFIVIQVLSEFLKFLFSSNKNILEKRHYIIKLFIHDICFIFVSIGNIAGWRGVWKSTDMIIDMTGKTIGLGSICVASFMLLVFMCSSTSLLLKGYIMDGSIEDWYNFPNAYIKNVRSVLKNTKKEIQDEEIPVEIIVDT